MRTREADKLRRDIARLSVAIRSDRRALARDRARTKRLRAELAKLSDQLTAPRAVARMLRGAAPTP